MKKWGKQTDLSLKFFNYGPENVVSLKFIHCIVEIKMAMAETNYMANRKWNTNSHECK